MHWLLTIDHALFHFINGTLGNPFFDWLMPILSGVGVPWLPVVAIVFIAAFIFGSTRLRLCAIFILLVVALGDPLIVGTVKKTVQRARPCVALAQTVERIPCGGHHSFPSAHSANWFAAAMVAFIFYRRRAWPLFLFAAAVAFSRVYNGVHFPGDVFCGAILGAGYAVAFSVGAQMLWNFFGKKFFPNWHSQLPNLLSAECKMPNTENSEFPTPNSELEWLRLGCLLIFVTLIARWIYIGSGIINLSGDEAYQWIWSKHLAIAYYSKPPGIALIQFAGTHLFGDTEFGVRFFSPLFAAILSVMVLRFLAREIGARNAFWMLLATFATPLLCVGSVLMTIDPPLVLCWMWAVVAGWRAVQENGKTRDWLIVGIALGLGFLSKATAALEIICFAIYFILQPSARRHLRKSGPWLALGIFALSTVPIIWWNAQNGWATVSHLAGNAQLNHQWHPTLKYFFEFAGAEFGLLNPIFFVAAIWASFAFWKRRAEKPLRLYLFCLGAPLFFGYWIWTLHSRVQPNWIAAAVPPMFCLMALFWNERPRLAKIFLLIAFAIGMPAAAILYSTSLTRLAVAKLPGDVDPAHRLSGWRETAATVETEREKFDTNSFIIADDYGTTGLYTFYSRAARNALNTVNPLVYCMDTDKPSNQFFFWDEYKYREHRRGENAIYISQLEPYKLEHGWIWKWLRHEPFSYREIPTLENPPPRLVNEFETVTNLGLREIKLDDGRIFHRVQIFGCYHLK